MPNVHLTDQMHRYAQDRVDAGAYANLSEVVRSCAPGCGCSWNATARGSSTR